MVAKLFRSLLLFPVILLALSGAQGPDDDHATMAVFRLPTTTKPELYELRFILDFDGYNSTFSGQARITVLAVCTVHVITLNAKDLNVTEAYVTDVELDKYLPVRRIVNRRHDEQLEIRLDDPVIANRTYAVTILYASKMRTDETGLNTKPYREGNTTK
jgi:hypothetical protein